MSERIQAKHARYKLHLSPQFRHDLGENQYYLEQTTNPRFVADWKKNVLKKLDHLQEPTLPSTLGEIDPDRFSDTFVHDQVPKTQTALFYIVEDDNIYMATMGWSGYPWKEILAEMQPELEAQIDELRRLNQRPSVPDPDAGIGEENESAGDAIARDPAEGHDAGSAIERAQAAAKARDEAKSRAPDTGQDIDD